MKIIAATLAGLLATCVVAQAQRVRPRETSPSALYFFGEYNYYTDSSALRGGGGGLGWNFNRYFGLQGGVEFLTGDQPLASSTPPGVASNTVNVDATVLYGEIKLSWPWTDRFSVYASAGGAYSDASASITLLPPAPVTVSVSDSASGYRFGAGAEYWFSRHWGLRAGWHQ